MEFLNNLIIDVLIGKDILRKHCKVTLYLNGLEEELHLPETKVLTLTSYLQIKSVYPIALYELGRNYPDDFVSQLENRVQYCPHPIDIKLIKLVNGPSHHQLLCYRHSDIKLTIGWLFTSPASVLLTFGNQDNHQSLTSQASVLLSTRNQADHLSFTSPASAFSKQQPIIQPVLSQMHVL